MQFAVCAVLLMRDDWNGSTFTSNATIPTRQISVCAEDSRVSTRILKEVVNYSGCSYSSYKGVRVKSAAGAWLNYDVIATSPQPVWSVDLFTIIQNTYASQMLPTNEALVGIEVRGVATGGVGTWLLNNLTLIASVVPSPNPPIPAPIAPTPLLSNSL